MRRPNTFKGWLYTLSFFIRVINSFETTVTKSIDSAFLTSHDQLANLVTFTTSHLDLLFLVACIAGGLDDDNVPAGSAASHVEARRGGGLLIGIDHSFQVNIVRRRFGTARPASPFLDGQLSSVDFVLVAVRTHAATIFRTTPGTHTPIGATPIPVFVKVVRASVRHLDEWNLSSFFSGRLISLENNFVSWERNFFEDVLAT